MRINEATSIQSVVVADIFAMSAGRFGAFSAGVLGVIGIVISGRALARSTRRTRADTDVGPTDGGPVVAIVLGLIGIAVGGLIVGTSDGSLGTGNGFGGAIVAIVLGLIATVLGGLARARRRTTA